MADLFDQGGGFEFTRGGENLGAKLGVSLNRGVLVGRWGPTGREAAQGSSGLWHAVASGGHRFFQRR
jgi:hypothetical protein